MANEDLLLRQMPHSLEGEQAVLGSMLIDEGCVKDVMDKLVPSDFYLRQNREIFETIYTMFTYARPIDGITVCEEMQKAGTYDENTTRSYLAQLMEITPTSANVMEYVAIVRDKALLRGVAQAAGEITVLVQEGIGEAAAILEAAEQKDLRRPPRPECAGYGASADGAARCAGPAQRDERERKPTSGPVHRLVRCGPEDQRPE